MSTLPQSNPSGSISYSASSSNPTAQPDLPPSHESTTQNRGSLSDVNPSSVHPAAQQTEVLNAATDINPLAAHHRPSVDGSSNQTSGVQGLPGDTTIRQGNVSQNAPGKAGDVGEGAVGALGFGGSSVGRPKEEQGLGEKIVNLLGS